MTTCSNVQMVQAKKETVSWSLLADSWSMLILVTMAGGFAASYSFLARGGVFAFAQTGNIIYSGHALVGGGFWKIFTFLLPVLSYMGGLLTARQLGRRFQEAATFQKLILLAEATLFLVTGLLPAGSLMTRISLCLMGYASGLQMETFHRLGEREYTCIMVMGNMKRTVDAFSCYLEHHKSESLHKAWLYVLINGIFCLGSIFGYVLTQAQGDSAILAPAFCFVLAAALLQSSGGRQ